MPAKLADRVLSWANDLEPQAAEQAIRCSHLPFVHGHIALMPDAHWGMGATVGSVIATKGAVIPAAVGVDIGCGMIAAQLDLFASQLPDDLTKLHAGIAQAIPAGVGKGHDIADVLADALVRDAPRLTPRQAATAATQLGSLGSGNHFVELCLDENDDVWLVLHSGSRGIGNQLATQHIECAKGLMKQYFIQLEDPDLAYLVEGTAEFDDYIAAMLWAQRYAMTNRTVMMQLAHAEVEKVIGRPVEIVDQVNCHHNFTQREHHMGTDLWVTRKGAIQAREGTRGVIPGSMGTRSYIVYGLGNPASFHSSSHGAGRRMSRGQARKTLDHQGLVDAMAGKAWNGNPADLIDEDPRAYKDIDDVMAAQTGLTRIEHTLRQVLNYKGT